MAQQVLKELRIKHLKDQLEIIYKILIINNMELFINIDA